MTKEELERACDQAGGVYALARMIGKRPKYLYRRLKPDKGKDHADPISLMDELAIGMALRRLCVSRPTCSPEAAGTLATPRTALPTSLRPVDKPCMVAGEPEGKPERTPVAHTPRLPAACGASGGGHGRSLERQPGEAARDAEKAEGTRFGRRATLLPYPLGGARPFPEKVADRPRPGDAP